MPKFANTYIKKCNALGINPLTQDELVELCKQLPKYQKKTYLQLLSCFRVGISRTCCNGYLESQTLNDLCLLFYINEAFGWGWFEGKNEWIRVNKYSSPKITLDIPKDS